jgi:hypothetical protein
MGMLTATAEPAKDIFCAETIDVVGDKGYFKIEDIEACEKAGMVPYVPRPQRGPSVREGLFRKDEFKYEEETDRMICPAGQRLQPYTSSLRIDATDIEEQKRLCREIQLQAFRDVPYIPLGAFFFATAYHNDLTGILKGGIPLFTNVRRA